ncbi:MAG: hypothetical protein M1834_002785 [Cirrosporium novae-zelandiae]|nr:MAG: hypothetical protein M1834_002785 [Cirrosporium novae-zelandiae]
MPIGRPSTSHDSQLQVGDEVNVPGGMWGVAKFVGSVKGKSGIFVGVELVGEFAAKGKNNGDVDGTSRPGAGIFLPLSRATKRPPESPQRASQRTPFSPSRTEITRRPSSTTPSKAKFRTSTNDRRTPGRPSLAVPAFSRSAFAGTNSTPPSPSKSGRRPTANKFSRPTSRAQPSRQGPDPRFDEEPENSPIGIAHTSDTPLVEPPLRVQDSDEVEQLRLQLQDRDRQLKEQAANLADMERSVIELQSLLPGEGEVPKTNGRRDSLEDADVLQLRALVKEKNEKIQALTAEFDSHRADFRSTIDTLELASSETERVYEQKVQDLVHEIEELQSRDENIETVANQLKQLEGFVSELEEGLEDARRGEAEARAEAEFLRGEVERGRSELRQEREKAAAALKGAGVAMNLSNGPNSKDIEQRDDEIRGLKAIIHSLSSNAVSADAGSPMQQSSGDKDEMSQADKAALERQVQELKGLIDRKTFHEEELEKEIGQLRSSNRSSFKHSRTTSRPLSEKTIVTTQRGSANMSKDAKGSIGTWREKIADGTPSPIEETTTPEATQDSDTDAPWCELCESTGHDILSCTMFGQNSSPKSQKTGRDAVVEGLKNIQKSNVDAVSPLAPRKSSPPHMPLPDPGNMGPVAGKASGVIDENKWCALCERDGHESVDCPFEDAF